MRLFLCALMCLLVLSGCGLPTTGSNVLVNEATTPLAMKTATPAATQAPSSTPTPTSSPTPTASRTPTPSGTPTATSTPSQTPTATWTWVQGQVVAPILLYHHIADVGNSNRYYVSVENFRQQMLSLKQAGYTSITPATLVEALVYGAELPPKPVVITFDDGNLDVYTFAFPIMRELGYIGAFYIVGDRLAAEGDVGTGELAELVAAGWEIGSHGMSHADLTLDHTILRTEILQSRLLLEEQLGIPVRTLAYPFGMADAFVVDQTEDYGYSAGMGLGTFNTHTLGARFYLSRREVRYEYDLTAFMDLLNP